MTNTTIRIAAIQPALEVGDVDGNMKRCADLVRSAAKETGARMVLLPEAYTSPNVYDPACRAVPQPVDGPAYELLRDLARELDVTVGGGYLSLRGGDARHTYVLAEPDGTTNLHDKDEPSAWEYCYYTGGTDDGVFTTPLGTIGCAMGWETARSRTARRLVAAGARLVVGGGCWPGFPAWPAPKWLLNRDYGYYRLWARDTTANLARAVGAPTALAWHVGPVKSRTPLMPGVPWPTEMTGETTIAERDGHVLARLGSEDGEAWISAEVTLADPQPLDEIPTALWLRPQTASIHVVWHYMKNHGRVRYALDKRQGRFPWQDLPAHDIPNYNSSGST
jgi:predicted amidohydrolase